MANRIRSAAVVSVGGIGVVSKESADCKPSWDGDDAVERELERRGDTCEEGDNTIDCSRRAVRGNVSFVDVAIVEEGGYTPH